MPNGGTDSCGTCGFNSRNRGEWQHCIGSEIDASEVCEIRGFTIENAVSTYCVNWHTQDRVPDGPVFIGVHNFVRVPRFNGRNPVEVLSGTCAVCGAEFQSDTAAESEGLQLAGFDGSDYRFCCAKHYMSWWRTKHGSQKLPYYNYMPRSVTLAKFAGRTRKGGVRICRHWWDFWRG